MNVSANKDHHGEDDVHIQKGLPKGVAHGREGEKEHEHRGDGGGRTRRNKAVVENLDAHEFPPAIGVGNNGPGNGVDDGLGNSNTSDPSVQQIVCVETDVEHVDEGVIAAGKEDERHHVDDREGA